MNKTKIVCTIGPSTQSYEKIIQLIQAGMNIARLNFSHGTHESHLEVIERLKKAREELNKPLAIMLDNKGPEVRLGTLKATLEVKSKDRLFLTKEDSAQEGEIPVRPFEALSTLEKGVRVLFDDGYIISHVVEITERGIWVEIENSGLLSSNKGINVPGIALNLPILTEQDVADIEFGSLHDIDILAASFIRSADHVLQIKKLLKEFKKPEILVISKIENYQGINHFDSILKVSDGIMVARGDLGVEVPLSQIPRLQKEMILKCFTAGKPAITATQMLESMIYHPRPTRAEVSDVANAIYDSTSCVMLSGESAAGKYPIEATQVLTDIILDTEAYFDYRSFFYSHFQTTDRDVPSALTSAAVNTAYTTGAKAIFVYSSTGYTSRLISKWRSAVPIIALTQNKKVYNQLALNWGIIPIYHPSFSSMEQAFEIICAYALKHKIVSLGDRVVVSAGSPFGVTGSTNMMLVQNIGNVLIRAKSGYGQPVSEKIVHLENLKMMAEAETKNAIVVLNVCNDSYLPYLKEAKGIILENEAEDIDSEKYALLVAKTLNIPVLVRAEGAFELLKNSEEVTLDPKSFLVYKGRLSL